VKPYLKANRNDFDDAEAIAEAAGRAHMRCFPLKTDEQLKLQALHPVRRPVIIERTAVVNQMRAYSWNVGSPFRSGVRSWRVGSPQSLKMRNGLSSRLVTLLHRPADRLRLGPPAQRTG